jgi:hypothetical protein
MNAEFVRKHVRCGKSRMRLNKRFPGAVWYGSPKSEQFIRCYSKATIDSFRIELQLNRSAILKHSLETTADWIRLPEVVEQHIAFFFVDWVSLIAYIKGRFRYPETIIRKAHSCEANLDRLLRVLRQVGVKNPIRFLVPMPENASVRRVLARWKRRWLKDGSEGP